MFNQLNAIEDVRAVPDTELLAATHDLVGRAQVIEADLLVHLGEVEERKLYLARAHATMMDYCVEELGCSEDVTYARLKVARLARRLPAVLDALRQRKVHLTGLRLLATHLTEENHAAILAEAVGKSRRQIEKLVARLAPQPPVADSIRRAPARAESHGVAESHEVAQVQRAGVAAARSRRRLGRDPPARPVAAALRGAQPARGGAQVRA